MISENEKESCIKTCYFQDAATQVHASIRLATWLPFLPQIAVSMFWSSQCSWAGAMPIHSLWLWLRTVDWECWLGIQTTYYDPYGWCLNPPTCVREGLHGVLSDIACHMMQGLRCHNYIWDLRLVMTLVAGEYGFAKAWEGCKVLWDSWDKLWIQVHGGRACLTILNHCIAGSDAHHHCRKQRRV